MDRYFFIPEDLKAKVKVIFGVVSFFVLAFAFLMPTEARDYHIQATDGKIYTVTLVEQQSDVRNFSVRKPDGEILLGATEAERKVAAELYFAARLLWDVIPYYSPNAAVEDWEESVRIIAEDALKKLKQRQLATIVAQHSVTLLKIAKGGAFNLPEAILGEINGAIANELSKRVLLDAALLAQAAAQEWVTHEKVLRDFWFSYETRSASIPMAEIYDAWKSREKLQRYQSLAWELVNKYLQVPNLKERLGAFFYSLLPVPYLQKIETIKSIEYSTKHLGILNDLRNESDLDIVVDAHYSVQAKRSRARKTLDEAGFYQPSIAKPIRDIQLWADESPRELDVRRYFLPNGDNLTYIPRSDNPDVAEVKTEQTGSSVIVITPKGLGSASISVELINLRDLRVTQSFMVTVKEVPAQNRQPVIAVTIPDQTLHFQDVQPPLDLSNYFRDPDGDTLTYGAFPDRNGIVEVKHEGSYITLTPIKPGTTTVVVKATDSNDSQYFAIIFITVRPLGTTDNLPEPNDPSNTGGSNVDVPPPVNVPPVAVPDLTNVAPDLTSIAPDLSSIAQDLSSIAQDLSNLAPDLTHLAPDLSSIAQDFSHLAQDFSHLAQDFSHLAPDLSSIAQDLSHLAPDLSSIAQDFSHLAPDLSGIAPDLSSIAPDLSSIAQDFSHLAPDLSGIAPDLSSIAPDLSSIAQDFSHLAPDLSGIAQDFSHLAPDLSSIAPDLSGIAPDLSGIAQDFSHLAPDLSGIAQDLSHLAPDLSGIAPDLSNLAPDTSNLTPDLSNLAPDTSNLTPDLSNLAPDLSGIAPDLSNLAPDTSNLTPDLSNLAPDLSGIAPDLSNLAPDTSNLAPDLSNLAPDLSGIAPDLSNLAPDLSNLAPDTSNLTPDLSNLAPDTSNLAPDLSNLAPDLTSLVPSFSFGFGTSTTSTRTEDICDRTQQVLKAILVAMDVEDCADLESEDLDSITALVLSDAGITALQRNDFKRLSGLINLDLHGNSLSSLPAYVFDDLDALESLNLSGNPFSKLPKGIFDDVLDTLKPNALALDDSVKATLGFSATVQDVAAGDRGRVAVTLDRPAPVALRVPYTIGGTATAEDYRYLQPSTELLFLAGQTRKEITLTLVKDADIRAETILLTLGELNDVKVRQSNGRGPDAQLSASTLLTTAGQRIHTITVTTDSSRWIADICDRTDRMGQVLSKAISAAMDVEDCANLKSEDLDSITALVLSDAGITALQRDDFKWLSGLVNLDLHGNSLSALPDYIFDELSSLETLDLKENSLRSLSTRAFDGLHALKNLDLRNNSLPSLSAYVFDELSSLETLDLKENSLSSVSTRTFSGLRALKNLDLQNNSLSSLPTYVFNDLDALESLNLKNNSLSRLPTRIFDDVLDTLKPNALVLDDSVKATLGFSATVQNVAAGDRVRVVVTLNRPAPVALRVPYTIGGTATAEDYKYLQPSEELLFYAGQTRKEITLTLVKDADIRMETILLTLGELSDVKVRQSNGRGPDAQLSASTLLTAMGQRVHTIRVTTDRSRWIADICDRTDRMGQVLSKAISAVMDVEDCANLESRDLDSITALVLSDAGITALQRDDFKWLSGLVNLDLHGNSLSALPDYIFDELSSLETLDLKENSLRSLSTRAFDGLHALKNLDLRNNSLPSLSAYVFDELSALETLDLKENSLRSLSTRAFDGLRALKNLDLRNNSLSSLPTYVFNDLDALESLNLENNSLSRLPTRIFDDVLDTLKPNALVLDDSVKATLGFSATVQDAAEGDRVRVVVTLNRPAPVALRVPYTIGGTATAEDYRYLQPLTELLFYAGQTRKEITLTLVKDADIRMETILLTLGELSDVKVRQSNGRGPDAQLSASTLLTTAGQRIHTITVTTDGSGISRPMYWTGGDRKIYRSQLNGTHPQVLFEGGKPQDIALDVLRNRMYWIDTEMNVIRRANLDGSEVVNVVSDISRPRGIALDVAGRKIYWTDAETQKIQQANLDGKQIRDLVEGLDQPERIALDVPRGKMYWTDTGTQKIQQANLNGEDVTDLVPGLGSPIDIALDVSRGKIYWTDTGTQKIQRANLNGKGVTDLVTDIGTSARGIALDGSGSKMYWTDHQGNKVYRANLDGSGIEEVYSWSRPIGIALAVGANAGVNAAPSAVNANGTPLDLSETALLANYPNPFNPETWIPYQLSEASNVTVSIYAVDGKLVRTLALGHQPAGVYRSRSRALHWDGRNAFGELVASGLYFYTFTAGDFTTTRKMLIRK